MTQRIFEKLFTIAEVSKLTKEEYMRYEKSIMAQWDEYAILKTAEEKGIEQGIEKKSYEVVKNHLIANKFTIAEIANFVNVSEAFVRKVKNSLK